MHPCWDGIRDDPNILSFTTPISFYPGPSQVYPQVGGYLQEAIDLNITGYNHRSAKFMEIVMGLELALYQKLRVPKDYKLAFLCSATEAWGCLANSFRHIPINHVYNGSFGEKWYRINAKLNPKTQASGFGLEETPEFGWIKTDIKTPQLLCICQNETSNATQVRNAQIAEARAQHPNALIAVDATSSMAGIKLDFENADIWFASVQKCFGLPAGLCVVLMSPRVSEYLELIDKSHYNHIGELYQKAIQHQTVHTPNVLNIYALSRLLKDSPYIEVIDADLKQRALSWRSFLSEYGQKQLSNYEPMLSDTVIALKADENDIKSLISHCEKKGFLVGKGYGAYVKDTFRIANFPALQASQITDFKNVLKDFWTQKM